MSIQQSRSFDGVCIIVPGCIAAVADAIIRRLATNHPSEVCSHLCGKTVYGQQLGHPGFGVSVGSFASQVSDGKGTRRAVYLLAFRVKLLKFMRQSYVLHERRSWTTFKLPLKRSCRRFLLGKNVWAFLLSGLIVHYCIRFAAYDLKPTRTLVKFLRMVSYDLGIAVATSHLLLTDKKPDILVSPYGITSSCLG
jgi:hypothetical protein